MIFYLIKKKRQLKARSLPAKRKFKELSKDLKAKELQKLKENG